MNKTFLTKVKNILLAQKQTILKPAINDFEIDTDGDEVDLIQAKLIVQLNNELIARNTNKLKQIDDALERIENKSYGHCQDCNEPILEKRLLHNPHFQTCVSCAEDRELEIKQRKQMS